MNNYYLLLLLIFTYISFRVHQHCDGHRVSFLFSRAQERVPALSSSCPCSCPVPVPVPVPVHCHGPCSHAKEAKICNVGLNCSGPRDSPIFPSPSIPADFQVASKCNQLWLPLGVHNSPLPAARCLLLKLQIYNK